MVETAKLTFVFVEGVAGRTWEECVRERNLVAVFQKSYWEDIKRHTGQTGELSTRETELRLNGETRRAALLMAEMPVGHAPTSEEAAAADAEWLYTFVRRDFEGRYAMYDPHGELWCDGELGPDTPSAEEIIEDGWAEHFLKEVAENRLPALLAGEKPMPRH